MRVLTVGNMYPPHHLGGYELVWQGAVDHMRAAGHDVTVLTTTTRIHAGAGADPPHVHRELGWYWRDHGFPPLTRRAARELAVRDVRILERELAASTDVIVWFSMGGLPLVLLERAARRAVGSVAIVHDGWPIYGPRVDQDGVRRARRTRSRVRARIASLAGRPSAAGLSRVDRVSFNSSFLRDSFLRRLPALDPARCVVDPPGVELDRLPFARSRPWEGRLLVIGRLDPRKGVDVAVRALSHLERSTTLRIVGDGDPSERERLVSLAKDLGVEERVTFAPALDDVSREYADADAVLFPVLWEEPYGLVPLEAMATGRPVVATARGGAVEFLDDGVNSIVVPPGDEVSLASAVGMLAGDGALRERLVRGGRATAETQSRARFVAAVARHVEDVGADRPSLTRATPPA